MNVLFLHGPAAAGKYTIGKALSETLRWPLFHNHLAVDTALSLFDFGTAGFCKLRAEIWRAAFREAANAKRSFIFTFHPEATVDPTLIEELVSIVDAGGGRILFVELQCSAATILSRLDNDSRHQFGKLTDKSLYAKVEREGGFDFPALPTPIVLVDTEQDDVDTAVSKIQGAVKLR